MRRGSGFLHRAGIFRRWSVAVLLPEALTTCGGIRCLRVTLVLAWCSFQFFTRRFVDCRERYLVASLLEHAFARRSAVCGHGRAAAL